jgi:hypothetical protein
VTKVNKRNTENNGGKQNGLPDERRRKGLSKKKQKNTTFKTTALNCFAFSKTRTSEYHVQPIKKNSRLFVCVQICLFLTTRHNSDGANFARDANRHQK